MEDVNIVFWKFNFQRLQELVGSGGVVLYLWSAARVGSGRKFGWSGRVTENVPGREHIWLILVGLIIIEQSSR